MAPCELFDRATSNMDMVEGDVLTRFSKMPRCAMHRVRQSQLVWSVCIIYDVAKLTFAQLRLIARALRSRCRRGYVTRLRKASARKAQSAPIFTWSPPTRLPAPCRQLATALDGSGMRQTGRTWEGLDRLERTQRPSAHCTCLVFTRFINNNNNQKALVLRNA